MTDFDADLLEEIANNAPVAGGDFSYTNYGRVWMDNLQISKYVVDHYEKTPYTGQPYDKDKEVLEFQLHQEIDKRDGGSFTKTWYLQLKDSGKRADKKTDWGETVKPSVLSTFKSLGAFFRAMSGDGSYCAVEDFVTGRTRKGTSNTGEEKTYDVTAPKFLEVFKSKKACQAAKEAKFAAQATGKNGTVPDSIVKSFKAFVKSIGGIEEARENLDDEYEGYDLESVIKASGIKE